MTPTTRYVKSGTVNIAYQVLGTGPRDLILIPGWLSNLEVFWEEPNLVRFLRSLAKFSRLILFDKRGTGLSDRVPDMPTLEVRMDDIRAVMDAVGSSKATLLGYSEGGPLSVLFAATYPERTDSVIMIGAYATRCRTFDYPWAPTSEERAAFIDETVSRWGGPVGIEDRAPSMLGDPRFVDWWARLLRMSASPGANAALMKMNSQIDVREILPLVGVPTLIIHNSHDRCIDVGGSRFMAKQIPGARYVELDGADHLPWVGNRDSILNEIDRFLTGIRSNLIPSRFLATVLFTDIVKSTEHLSKYGDDAWGPTLKRHNEIARHEITRFNGVERNYTGDGFMATFDGPERAIHCAYSIGRRVRSLGLEIRAGLHAGELTVIDDNVGGISVHIAARIIRCSDK